jgi:hypothetical protein
MPLLYEPEQSLPKGVYKIGFSVIHVSDDPEQIRQTVLKRLLQYNWLQHGLDLKNAEVNATTSELNGVITLKVLNSFIVWPLVVLLIPSILGFVGTIAKLWVIREVASPLLQPGPLGLPMIVWILITAAGVLIPLAIILKRK